MENAPWGTLDGIRPTKLIYKFLRNNPLASLSDAIDFLINQYSVSEEKARLATEVVNNQQNYLDNYEEYVNLYVHIPFCPTRCKYCSFVSLPLSNKKNITLIDEYLGYLLQEIEAAKELLARQNKKILSVYIGGGTPTSLDDEQLNRLLLTICLSGIEYTVEAGRPDTITPSKIAILRQNGVNRISINPQTFHDSTLQTIGRSHTAADIHNAFNHCQGMNINMDLIAGLPNETLDDFIFSLESAIKLNPENITLHTLSIKNGSEYFFDLANHNSFAPDMVNYAHKRLKEGGYLPYYLYRQKKMAGGLENVGYSKPNNFSINNITVMEELVSVMACGAGAISKIIIGDRIERLANVRDVRLYIEQFDERLITKHSFFCNLP